jgi:transcriptional regulator with XRE-family HTH domain
MAGKKTDTGPTGQTVASNLTRIREHKGLTYTQVSKLLASGGRNISPLAVRRIEDGERKVDADDLMALASVLDVSPTYFLMPSTDGPEDEVSVTGRAAPVEAKKLYDFLHGEHGIEGRPVRVAEWLRHLLTTAPAWRIDEAEAALRTLSDFRMADEWRGQESEIPGFKNGND